VATPRTLLRVLVGLIGEAKSVEQPELELRQAFLDAGISISHSWSHRLKIWRLRSNNERVSRTLRGGVGFWETWKALASWEAVLQKGLPTRDVTGAPITTHYPTANWRHAVMQHGPWMPHYFGLHDPRDWQVSERKAEARANWHLIDGSSKVSILGQMLHSDNVDKFDELWVALDALSENDPDCQGQAQLRGAARFLDGVISRTRALRVRPAASWDECKTIKEFGRVVVSDAIKWVITTTLIYTFCTSVESLSLLEFSTLILCISVKLLLITFFYGLDLMDMIYMLGTQMYNSPGLNFLLFLWSVSLTCLLGLGVTLKFLEPY
jgi:hypothetical protein